MPWPIEAITDQEHEVMKEQIYTWLMLLAGLIGIAGALALFTLLLPIWWGWKLLSLPSRQLKTHTLRDAPSAQQ